MYAICKCDSRGRCKFLKVLNKSKKKIIVIGSLNMDMVMKVDHMTQVGETVLGQTLEYQPGGKGANQSCAAGLLGEEVIMLGCVSDDENGQKLLNSLDKRNVNISKIRVRKNGNSGMAAITVDAQGNNSIVVFQGANRQIDKQYIYENAQVFEEGDIVLLSMEVPYEVVFEGIRLAKVKGCTVILNPAPAPEPQEFPEDIWEKIDYITPNETEAAKLTKNQIGNIEEIITASQILLNHGVKNVLITLGDKGALLSNQKGSKKFEAEKVMVCDTTAAGDCFNGALAVALAEEKKQEEAVRFANRAASIAVTRKGAQNSLPTRKEVLG